MPAAELTLIESEVLERVTFPDGSPLTAPEARRIDIHARPSNVYIRSITWVGLAPGIPLPLSVDRGGQGGTNQGPNTPSGQRRWGMIA